VDGHDDNNCQRDYNSFIKQCWISASLIISQKWTTVKTRFC